MARRPKFLPVRLRDKIRDRLLSDSLDGILDDPVEFVREALLTGHAGTGYLRYSDKDLVWELYDSYLEEADRDDAVKAMFAELEANPVAVNVINAHPSNKEKTNG